MYLVAVPNRRRSNAASAVVSRLDGLDGDDGVVSVVAGENAD
jgi:hypothetical protein